MALFAYTGRDRRGESVNGQIEAASADAVATQLFNNGVTPIDIEPAGVGSDVFGGLRALQERLSEGRIELVDQVFFCRQMYTLLKAGVPILQALRGLRETTRNPALAKVIGSLSDTLDAGQDISAAFRRHPVFSSLFISMVQVGENTGSLPEAFQQLAEYLEREKDTRDRIKQAMRYPVFVLIALVIALAIINLFVIPAFAKVYAGFRAQLPLPTRMLIAMSNFTVSYWYLIAAGVFGSVYGWLVYIRTPAGRYRWHKWKLRLPVVGSVIFRATLARFARSLAITIKSGVPIVQGMTVVSRSADNDFVTARLEQMRDGLERGETITRTAAATGLFPPLVLQMVSVGEETGAVDQLMAEVADYYDREVDYDLKHMSSAIEPILLVIVGILVLILALGVFLPMWDLAKAARGG